LVVIVLIAHKLALIKKRLAAGYLRLSGAAIITAAIARRGYVM
jgi:hypothetical protein